MERTRRNTQRYDHRDVNEKCLQSRKI